MAVPLYLKLLTINTGHIMNIERIDNKQQLREKYD